MESSNNKNNILILGAGVAGIRAALDLEKKLNTEQSNIILIDQNDYHQYLYKIQEVCNVDYKEKDIIVFIEDLIKNKKIEFVKTIVKDIDTEKNIVNTTGGNFSYDYLVIALGSDVAYFGIEGLEENSMTLSSYNMAIKIRNKIIELFNKSSKTKVPPKIVVGGGGFTGVELAGEIADWYPMLCSKHKIEKPEYFVTIVEMMPTILPGWNEDLVMKGQEVLDEIGVELKLGDAVAKVDENQIFLKSGQIIEPDLFIWNGGVMGNNIVTRKFSSKGRRIEIDDFCHVKGYNNIFVAGDSACTTNKNGKPLPPTAHIAMVQGSLVANNISSQIKSKPEKTYVNKHIGEIVTLGRTYAIGDLFGIKFKGILARIMKKIVHLWYLHSIGGFSLLFKNM